MQTTYLGIPCVTLRTTTEGPVTVEVGTNYLSWNNTEAVKKIVFDIVNCNMKKREIPELWDGKSAGRIVSILLRKDSLCQ